MSTSTRILELLGLLQNRRHWPGYELAKRLEISQRTLRRDVDSLQQLGYPIVTTRGTGGGYHLSAGTALPPLVLSEEEAAATVLGLKTIATGVHPASSDAALSAMAKIVQVLPPRIRRRIDSLRAVATSPRSEADHAAAITDVSALTTLTLACRDTETVDFTYRAWSGEVAVRTTHPHRVVNVEDRLYLIAWDADKGDWRTFRIDRITNPRRTGGKFAHRKLPTDDPVEYINAQLGSIPARYRVHATVHASADRVRDEVGHYGTVEAIDPTSCTLFIAAESLEWATFCIGSIGSPVVIHSPPEAIKYMHAWAQRLLDGTSKNQ